MGKCMAISELVQVKPAICRWSEARQNLREIPQLLAMGVGSQGNSRGPSKRFILGTVFLSWHSDIFIEGRDKTILETMVS